MARHFIRRLSSEGDSPVAEWDTTTVTRDRLEEIEIEYNQLMAAGATPADITDTRNELKPGAKFDPNADTLMIPRMTGG